MPEVCLSLDFLQEIVLSKQFQYPIDSDIDNIQFAKQVSFILFIDLPLTNKNMIKWFLNEHMKYVIKFMLEEKVDNTAEEFSLTDLFEDTDTWNWNTVAQYLSKILITSSSL